MTDTDTLGDQHVEPEYLKIMQEVAQGINAAFNGDVPPLQRKTAFVLMVFPFNVDSGRCNYVTNGVGKEDVLNLLRDQVLALAGRPHGAEIQRLLKLAEQREDFVTLEDGCVYYSPDPANGGLSSWMLRALADELDRRNARWEAHMRQDPAISGGPTE